MNKKIIDYRDNFNTYLASQEFNDEPQGLYEPISYLMKQGGKRIRPLALLMTYDIYSDDYKSAIPLAYAIEMFHNFTLAHDDIMDKAEIRRGKATIHIKYNINRAILSGDAMMIKAYQIVLNIDKPLDIKDRILKIFTQAALEVCEGQQLDLDFESKVDVDLNDYLLMIKYKTAILLATSFLCGVVLGGGSEEEEDHLYKFGLNLGLAFQIQDDILDLYGDQNTFGKLKGGDIIQQKKTYLYLRAIEKGSGKTATDLKSIYKNKVIHREEKVAMVKRICDDLEVLKDGHALVEELINNALDHLKRSTIEEVKKDQLRDFARELLGRNV